MSGGNQGLNRAEPTFKAAIGSAEGGVGADEGGGGLDERLSCVIMVGEGATTQDFVAGDVVVRSEAEPGAESFDILKVFEGRTDFGEDDLGQRDTQAGQGDQVNPRDALDVLTDDGGLIRFVFAVRAAFSGEGHLVVRIGHAPIGADGAVGALNLLVAGLNLSGVEVIELKGLLEDKEMFFAPGAGEG